MQKSWVFTIKQHGDGLRTVRLTLCEQLGKEIEVVNEVENGKEDLMQDFVSIITSFCARIYGQRRSKRTTEKLIKDLQDDLHS